jgi:ferredoxin-NADP reductase
MALIIKTEAEVVKKIDHTAEVSELHFKPLKRIHGFKAGQFLHLAIDEYDGASEWPESRVFSIMNSPTRKDEIVIVVSAKGTFTKRIVNDLKEGDSVWLKLPYGEFSFEKDVRPVVLIAGGTGISPFLSYLDYCLDDETQHPLKLYYGVRNSSLFLFKDKLDCYTSIKGFELHSYMEEGSVEGCKAGRIDIEEVYHENKNAVFYLSGPWVMIAAFRDYLSTHGVETERIRIDEW